MTFELVIFILWVICLISYCILSWTTIVEIRLSSSGDSVFEGSNGSFDLRKVPSCEGDDIATFLCRQGYELGSKLGEGAYAVVREAYSNKHGRNVAIKIINKEKLSDRTLHKFLKREVETLRLVDHKNVICLLEVIESTRRFYIIMELAHNGDLLKLLQERGRLPEPEAKRVFKKIVKGILHCHKKGIAHRDLKLENILLSRKNEPIISDFGFARNIGVETTEAGSSECESRARSCTFCGSYAYAAPEILQGIPYDATLSDVWSLGVLLFAMVTGQFPFDDSSKKHLLREAKSGNINFGSRESNLSEQVKDLIRKMLTPDVKTRFTLENALEHPWMNRKGAHLLVPSSWRRRPRAVPLVVSESDYETVF